MTKCYNCGEDFDGSGDYCSDCSLPQVCKKCKRKFLIADFDGIDDEFDEYDCLCPNCQEDGRIANEMCEYCDKPATHEAGDFYLCDDCYEDYADGFFRD